MSSKAVCGAALLLVATLILCHCPECIQSAKLPKTFIICNKNQPELNKCVGPAITAAINAMKDGIPSLHVLPIDPLLVTSMNLELGSDRSVNLKIDITNASLTGLTDMEMQTASMDTAGHRLDAQVHIPKLELKGDYEMSGRFLLLPLTGKGKFEMSVLHTDVTQTILYDEKIKNGNVYWHLISYDINLQNVKKFSANFENLFNGDKTLGESTNRVLNENWEVLWNELRPRFQDTFGQIFTEIGNTVYSRVPIKDQFLD